jgi:hypothetical protein
VLLKHPVLYDASRHFLFLFPPLAVLAGHIIARTMLLMIKQRPFLRGFFYLFLLYGIISPLKDMMALHPYQYIYFNDWVGGLRGASGRYETDYHAMSYQEAVALLDNYLGKEKDHSGVGHPYLVHACGPMAPAKHYFTPQMTYALWPQEAEFLISTTRQILGCGRIYPGKMIGEITRFGIPLSYVYDWRTVSPEERTKALQ